jgi:hypothetical protein
VRSRLRRTREQLRDQLRGELHAQREIRLRRAGDEL